MLDSLIRNALRYRQFVVIVSLAVLIYGSYLATTTPIDVFPDLDRPRVVIITEAPGLATEEVETLVTQPIEIALMGASGVQAVRSQSTAGLNVLYVEFDWSTEISVARQTVQERLTTLEGVLPAGIRPQMTPPSSIMGQIVVAGLYAQTGPRGGRLTPVGETGMLAEWTGGQNGEPQIQVWQPVERENRGTWQPVACQQVDWEPSSLAIGPLQNGPRQNDRPVDRNQGSDAGTVTLRIGEQSYQATFQTTAQQLLEMRTIADWIVRPRLLKTTGVAEVFMQGGDRKQYQILIDPTALLEYDVTVQEVEQALRASNINTSGGFAVTGETERPIRILGRLGPTSRVVIADLNKIPIGQHPKRSVLLEQVARVTEGAQLKRGDGSIDGRPGVVFTIVKQPHVDTRQLTDDVARAFAEVEASLPANLVINTELFRLKNFIDRGIWNVGEALVIGAGLVIVVLFLFLLNFRTTFITLTAIPLSLVLTTLVFRCIGLLTGNDLSINVMTLGGIAVAMGELVDDAIVDVENIFRRLKQNNALPQAARRAPLAVVYAASKEIRSSIAFGTAVVILSFLPLFALSGVEGRLFTPLGVAYIVSILASFFVSLTVTPVLSYYLLPHAKATRQASEGGVLRMLKAIARPLIRISMQVPGMLLLLTWIAAGLAGWQLTQLGRNFLPPFDEGSIQVNVTLPPGSSLDASNQVSAAIDRVFQSLQLSEANPGGEILHFVRRTGRAEMDEHASPVHAGEYILSMNPASETPRGELLTKLRTLISEGAPGVDIEVEQPLAHLISHMVSGVYAQIAIKVYGDNLETLQSIASQVQETVRQVPGVTPPIVEPIRETAELHISLRADDLALYGLTRQYVADVLQTALQGEVVSQVLEGQRRFDLLVRLEEEYRSDYANLGRLRIHLPDRSGETDRGQIELAAVADIGEGLGPNSINRENARRRIVIRCNTEGRDLAGAVQDIKQRVGQQVQLPVGYFVEYGGQFESQQNATNLIVILAGASLIGIFLVLLLLFPSVKIVLQILNAIPTAFIGGVLALVITEQNLTVASLVGFISLGGIAVRNGILLVTHYLQLMENEGETFTRNMIMRGSLERLAPVLMTALTAGIGLIPLVWGGDEPGREILYPVATVILGGIMTSTFCEFLIHPGLFWQFSGGDAERIASERLREEAEDVST